MEISPRKPSKRAQEPVDEWLQNEGYFRKQAPRDPTCLFRAVSEQVYMTQYYHIRVRKKCVEFMRKMKHLFEENVMIPFDDYLEQMACFTEWGGMNEIQAMSLLFKREFVIFNGQRQTRCTVTDNGFQDTIYLCHTPQKQYDTIYTRDVVATAAYCQSIVYQVLYKDVFHMSNIETTIHKMLHDRTGTFRHDKFFLKGNLEMRDQLTAEIYNKVENGNGNDEVDDAQTIVRNIPPFPYRVAKALDPNIYRNTDFDIWHEIRKEVKNAGWTKHNSHELQVGSKCLVQMEFNEEEFDKANNNNVYVTSFEKDANGNDNVKVLQKKGKPDPVLFYGHIQEMNKNQGPVLVFIEELGEKKIVPYCALKPIPLRKNKQNNWLPMCKKNVLDSNHKWKKTCSVTSRKIQTVSNDNILSSNIDKNENNDNSVNDVNRNNYQWKEESSKIENRQTYGNYGLKKCPDYLVNSTDEIFSTRMILDNIHSSAVDDVRQKNGTEHKEKNPLANKCSEDNVIKNSKFDCVTNTGNNAEFHLYPKQETENDNYCLSYSGESVPVTQMNNVLCSINCSVQKSVDVNGSDLPLSDPFTLRFFYNLGLEYFHGTNNWNYLTNGQSPGFGQWYQGMPQNEEEVVNVTNGIMQNCTLTPQKKEDCNDRKETYGQSLCQENGDNYMNGVKDVQIQSNEVSRGKNDKDLAYSPREKIKEQEPVNADSPRISRNGLGPRFKKSSDNRYRNNQQFPSPSNQYLHSGPNSKQPKSQEAKGSGTNLQCARSVPHQVHASTDAVNSYQTSYVQPGMYYANEVDAFTNSYYSPSPYFPIPCLPYPEIPDSNSVQPFAQHLCPGVDYAQAYPGLCPPYICPQPAPYNMSPQNMQEHWYAVAGQPHYMQYAPMLPITAETTCNGIAQNVNQHTSSQNI
ncbi:uncharacterized protein LOC143348583 [Colletes latitarsis]|uniref:uncharacterized protein LOC143348583 n=1 Tax=Colletes latitarsis TaxID=2605962 RepID=UPI0040351838